jgi:hypothetical protein
VAQDQKGALRRHAWVVFLDESGISLTPVVHRTWAPRGQPPVLVHPFGWRRASMCAAICAKIGGGGAQVAFDIRPGSYNTDRLIEVLGELHRFLDGDKVTLVWDNLSPTPAARCAPGSAPSGPGWSSSSSRRTRPT